MNALLLMLLAAAPVKGSEPKCARGELRECAYLAFNRMDWGKVEEARTFAKKACDGGEQLGCVALGQLEMRAHDEDAAVARFETACDKKEPAGCLAMMSLHADPNGARHDAAKAEADARRACDFKAASGCAFIGSRLREQQKPDEAAKFFDRACGLDDELACGWLGEMYAAGEGVEKDPNRAAPLLARGCLTMMKSCNRFRDALDVPCKAGDQRYCSAAKRMETELQKRQGK